MVRRPDGTSLRAWSNDGTGEPVLLCNGLGAPPEAWPRIIARDSGFRVVSWYHRGLGGSERPEDRERVRVEDHADDARAVLDSYGLPSATLVGWSVGVNVAFELALQDPGRVTGVLAVAGVPGGSFDSLFAPSGVPRSLRAPMGRLGSRLFPMVGPLLPVVAASLPHGEDAFSARALSGPAREVAHLGTLGSVVREFSRHDWTWYRHLALAMGAHSRRDVSAVRCPVTFVAGRFDSLVDVRDVRTAADSIRGAWYRELAGTHFLPLQYPDVRLEELDTLVTKRPS